MAFGDLWKVDHEGHSIYLVDPDGDYRILVLQEDVLFARVLCHVLNSASSYKLSMSNAEMDQRGVPK